MNSQIEDGAVQVFGKTMLWAFNALTLTVRNLEHAPCGYEWMDEDAYKGLLTSRPQDAQRVLAQELLFTSHFAACTAIVRSYRWACGCIDAHQASRLLPFAANLRGLLEASADAYDGLAELPETLARAYPVISGILERRNGDTFYTFSELEQKLEHYAHARRLSRDEKKVLPARFAAKEGRELLKSIEPFDAGYQALYSELCELAHPASDSVCYMLRRGPHKQYLTVNADSIHIAALLKEHQGRIGELLRLLVPALLTLKALSRYPLEELRVAAAADVDLSFIPLWTKKMEPLLR